MEFLVVFIGSGIGGTLRYGVGRASLILLGPAFPYGTMAINIVGSFAMGIVAGWFTARGGTDQSLRLFLTTGSSVGSPPTRPLASTSLSFGKVVTRQQPSCMWEGLSSSASAHFSSVLRLRASCRVGMTTVVTP